MKLYYKKDKKVNHEVDVHYTRMKDKRGSIVYLHGGYFIYGDKLELDRYAIEFMNENGYDVVNANYSLAKQGNFPQQITDMIDLFKFISKLDNIDSQNLYLVGREAGAYLATAFVAMYTNPILKNKYNLNYDLKIKALALFKGFYDLEFKEFYSHKQRIINGRLFGTRDYKSNESWQESSCLNNITNAFPRCYFFEKERSKQSKISKKICSVLEDNDVDYFLSWLDEYDNKSVQINRLVFLDTIRFFIKGN